MNIKTRVKAGGITVNHNQTAIRATGVVVKSRVKAGALTYNHTETAVNLHRS